MTHTQTEQTEQTETDVRFIDMFRAAVLIAQTAKLGQQLEELGADMGMDITVTLTLGGQILTPGNAQIPATLKEAADRITLEYLEQRS